mmetsp:Transcript_34441/g.98863  ORF Transcript_34441/g.98863 Transcript_34441/m.98863 type:complete len:130 (+) Transcript_34441:2-391(+)
MGKGYGKGDGGGGGGYGKGKGRGKGRLTGAPEQKVWIGNLSEETKWKDLQTFVDEKCAKSTWVEVFGGKNAGTGAVIFKTAEEATAALALLNGAELNGQALVADAWVPKPKEEETPEEGKAAPAEAPPA